MKNLGFNDSAFIQYMKGRMPLDKAFVIVNNRLRNKDYTPDEKETIELERNLLAGIIVDKYLIENGWKQNMYVYYKEETKDSE